MEPGQMTSTSTSYIKHLYVVKDIKIQYFYCQFWLVQHASCIRCLGIPESDSGSFWYRCVFQELPEPNRACLVGVYMLSLYGIIYVTWYTRLLPKPTGVRYR